MSDSYETPEFLAGVHLGEALGQNKAWREAKAAYEAGEIELWLEAHAPKSPEDWEAWKEKYGPIGSFADRWK